MGASVTLFPYLSVNDDETVYLLQADTLRQGRLFPPAPPAEADAFLPWLSAHVGDHYVPKYSPVWPAVIAAGRMVTGSNHAAQALVAAAVVVMTYLLAREVLGRRWPAVMASLFVVLSPFFLVQSATFLSYLPNVLLLESFAVTFLRGARQGSRWLLASSGVLLGLALFARPFDAVLFALPFGLWLVVSRRRSIARMLSDAAWVTVGLIPPVVAMLAFFKTATGSVLRSPFLLDESDTLGFGGRRIFPSEPKLDYGVSEAWHGLAAQSVLLSFWCFGGLVLIGLAVVAVRRQTTGLERWVGLVALTIPLGYLFFWGSYVLAQWEAPWRIGPYYYLPVVVPLAILGAGGFSRLWHFDRRLASLALVGMTAVSGFVLQGALRDQRDRTAVTEALHRPVEAAPLDNAIVFLPQYRPHLMQPFTKLRNPSLDQNVLWALDRGDEANLRVLDLFPQRTPYLLSEGVPGVLQPLERHRGEVVSVAVDIQMQAVEQGSLLAVGRGDRLETFPLPASGEQGRLRLQLAVSKGDVFVEGPVGERRLATRTPGTDEPDVLLWLLPPGPPGQPEEELETAGFDVRRLGDEVELLLPTRVAPERTVGPRLQLIAGR